MNDHDRWDELAAGHALSALEPDETESFTAHLAGCARCQAALDDHSLVAAQLGQLVEDEDEAPSWSRMRSGIVPPAPTSAPTSLDAVRARRRNPRLLAAAASVVLLLGVGAGALLLADGSSSTVDQALAACQGSASCRVVHLQGKADLLVEDGAVRVLSHSLGTAPAHRVFVLWQLPRDGKPTLVAELSNTSANRLGEAHALALPYGSTSAFGLSLEPSGIPPTVPTDIVALGKA